MKCPYMDETVTVNSPSRGTKSRELQLTLISQRYDPFSCCRSVQCSLTKHNREAQDSITTSLCKVYCIIIITMDVAPCYWIVAANSLWVVNQIRLWSNQWIQLLLFNLSITITKCYSSMRTTIVDREQLISSAKLKMTIIGRQAKICK